MAGATLIDSASSDPDQLQAPSPSNFVITEAVATPIASPIADDGTVLLHIIRPGVGRGKGNHLYEADMLARDAGVFAGWKMYIDHETPDSRKARGGLPRPFEQQGGRVLEAWWDPNVPADPVRGHGAGAVVGKVRPVRKIRDMIEDDPALVEASIAATATGVKQVTRGGKRVWLVEGIEPNGSVDWVSEGGAGGRIPLSEGAYNDDEERAMAALDSLTDDELLDYARERGLAEAVAAPKEKETPAEDDAEGGKKGEMQELVRKAMKEGKSLKDAIKWAKAELAKSTQEAADGGTNTTPEGGDDMGMTPEVLREALASDDVRAMVQSLVEAEVAEERELIRAEVEADADRKLQVRDLRDEAERVIAESKLPEEFRNRLRGEYTLTEGNTPTAKLDVYDEVDEEGEVVKSASDALREALDVDIKEQRRLIASVRPTQVTDQGADGEGNDIVEGAQPPATSYWREHLQHAGVDPDTAYKA